MLSNFVSGKEGRELAKKRKPSEKKVTSKETASKASKILRDGRYSKDAKSVAGSALAQAKGKKGK